MERLPTTAGRAASGPETALPPTLPQRSSCQRSTLFLDLDILNFTTTVTTFNITQYLKHRDGLRGDTWTWE